MHRYAITLAALALALTACVPEDEVATPDDNPTQQAPAADPDPAPTTDPAATVGGLGDSFTVDGVTLTVHSATVGPVDWEGNPTIALDVSATVAEGVKSFDAHDISARTADGVEMDHTFNDDHDWIYADVVDTAPLRGTALVEGSPGDLTLVWSPFLAGATAVWQVTVTG